MNNTSNALSIVLISVVGIVLAAAITVLFAFGFFPLLATSVIYINITSLLILTLTLIFAFILYLKRGNANQDVVFDLKALSILSVVSLIVGVATAALTISAAATSSIILVALLSLFFSVTVLVTIKLVFDLLEARGCANSSSACGSCREC